MTKVMKWLLCAAFFTLHSSLFTLLTSCSDDIENESANASKYMLTRGYSDEQILLQRLGYAYNAAGNVMDDSSFSVKPIINMARLEAAESKYGLIINSERRHYTSMDIFSGNTLHDEIIRRGLKVMDMTAIVMCRDNGLPIYVFNMDELGNLARVINGEQIGTLVKP